MEYRIDAKVGPVHVCPAIAHGLTDAHLIAAAPDLLAALHDMVRWFGDYPEYIPHPDRWDEYNAAISAARAAIAKATTVTS
jgi:hypothetical protein